MSRIGKQPIHIPAGVSFTMDKNIVTVKGPKGELVVEIPQGIEVTLENGVVVVENKKNDKPHKALHGWMRAHLFNMVTGVSTDWTKVLELVGVGYRAAVTGVNLVLNVGYSHAVTIEPPAGITFVVAENKITVSGIDKQLVGQVAANIKKVRKPEPYKGKGIRYLGEHIRRKAGKSAKAIGGAK